MTLQFCPKCAGTLHQKAENLYICQQCNFHFYENPIPASSAIIENEIGEILITKRAFEPKAGTLDIPGGFANPHETAEETVIRECQEELGVTISNPTYFKSYADTYIYQERHSTVQSFVFTTQIDSSTKLTPNDDVAEAKWFNKEKIPFNQIGFPSIIQTLRDYLHFQ